MSGQSQILGSARTKQEIRNELAIPYSTPYSITILFPYSLFYSIPYSFIFAVCELTLRINKVTDSQMNLKITAHSDKNKIRNFEYETRSFTSG